MPFEIRTIKKKILDLHAKDICCHDGIIVAFNSILAMLHLIARNTVLLDKGIRDDVVIISRCLVCNVENVVLNLIVREATVAPHCDKHVGSGRHEPVCLLVSLFVGTNDSITLTTFSDKHR